jgi:hypothetical protein
VSQRTAEPPAATLLARQTSCARFGDAMLVLSRCAAELVFDDRENQADSGPGERSEELGGAVS